MFPINISEIFSEVHYVLRMHEAMISDYDVLYLCYVNGRGKSGCRSTRSN